MCTFMCCTFFVRRFPVTIGLRGLFDVFYFPENSKYFRDLRDRFSRSRKIEDRHKSRKNSNSEKY